MGQKYSRLQSTAEFHTIWQGKNKMDMQLEYGSPISPGLLEPGSGTGLLGSMRNSVKAGTVMTPFWNMCVKRVGVGFGVSPTTDPGVNVSPCMRNGKASDRFALQTAT